jgi:hypothetical protein
MPGAGWTGTLNAPIRLSARDGAASDRFGRSLAVDGDTLVVGAPGAGNGSSAQGAVYAFVKPLTGWATGTETSKLNARDGAAGDDLGTSVGISGGVIVGGASQASVGGHLMQGAAYAFDTPPYQFYLPLMAKP